MTTVFGKLGDELYEALLEPDATRRRTALEEWADRATEAMSKEIRAEIGSYLEYATEGRWTDEGWQRGANKFRSIRPSYHLTLEIKLQSLGVKPTPPIRFVELQEPLVPGPKSRGANHQLLRESAVRVTQAPKKAAHTDIREGAETPERVGDTGITEDDGSDEGTGRSTNDDRSDSMNPNNDAHQAAMDNHANQLNPDHSAYWSSRGH